MLEVQSQALIGLYGEMPLPIFLAHHGDRIRFDFQALET
jgi:hypothetical protein